MKYLLFLFITNKLTDDSSIASVVHSIRIQNFCSLQEFNLPTSKNGILCTCGAERELLVHAGRRQHFSSLSAQPIV